MAREMGLGVIPWSPLASGVLTGKYQQSDLDEHGSAGAEGTRKNVALGNGALSERGLKIAEVVKAVAGEMGKAPRSEEHTSELQSLMRISYAVFCLKKKKQKNTHNK